MITRTRDIFFTIIYQNQEIKVITYEGEYRNLMILINEKIYVEDFGECKGTGRCGTCLVEAEGLSPLAEIMQRNEKSTLEKSAIKKDNLRLSCQLMVNHFLQNARIKIVEERVDLR
jgi:2Fe-2S ferredoxin